MVYELNLNKAVKETFSGGSDSKESLSNAGDLGSIPGSGRSPGEGNGYPFQYSYLENSMETFTGTSQATVQELLKLYWCYKCYL